MAQTDALSREDLLHGLPPPLGPDADDMARVPWLAAWPILVKCGWEKVPIRQENGPCGTHISESIP